MSGRFGGVTRHALHLDGQVPVAVSVTLAHGVEATVDLVGGVVTQTLGPPLKPKQTAWLVEIAGFLARQHLLETVESGRDARDAGQATLSFEPRPKPGMIWWG